jgi:hypothetical protein
MRLRITASGNRCAVKLQRYGATAYGKADERAEGHTPDEAEDATWPPHQSNYHARAKSGSYP